MIKMEKGKEGLMEEDDVERKRGVMDVYSERGRQRASEDDEEGKETRKSSYRNRKIERKKTKNYIKKIIMLKKESKERNWRREWC